MIYIYLSSILPTLLLSCKISSISNNTPSLFCLFASKPGKICTRNSIDIFLITCSSVVCSEFNHSSFTIMVRVKRIIFNYFNFFKTRLTSKWMKYISSLFILVFVYCKVSPKHFFHVFKNRGRSSIPLHLNPHPLICSTKVRFLVHYTYFTSLCNFPNTLPNG